MITAEVKKEIEGALGKKIMSFAPLSAANNAQIERVYCDDKTSYVAKIAERGLDIEAWMMEYLAEKSDLPVPAVFYSNEHIIIMEFLEAYYSPASRVQKDAAEKLAALHQIHAGTYGLERDTLIGSLPQPNTPSKNWHDFFAEHRLLYMARRALEEGKIDKKIMSMVEKLSTTLDKHLDDPPPPSLIHGDVWSGNVIFGKRDITAFLDPAIYYADPEIELAFINLFNTFDNTFFQRYHEINPIRAGFEERADIYNIYPLLVHARLFGTSYARKIKRILEKRV